MTVHRIEVAAPEGETDPRGEKALRRAQELGYPAQRVRSCKVYLLEGELDARAIERVCVELLADPVLERSVLGARDAIGSVIEVHPLPGVMDPAAQSVRDAVHDLVGVDVRVSTGDRYDFVGLTDDQARTFASRALTNTVIHAIHDEPLTPSALPNAPRHEVQLRHIEIRNLDDDALEKLSRDGHLFLDLTEMRAIRDEYRRLEREPTDIELETLAQTWSEHCVHKTLKSKVRYSCPLAEETIDWVGRTGVEVHGDGSVTIDNLLRSTVAAATHELIDEGVDWTLSVFVDNAGIIRFDDEHAVCVKVETHNHPSAIEPYGGAATGIGGCIRDIIGTGLAAKPIASTDVFCVADPFMDESDVPSGCIHPRRILTEIVAGVRDYGNRMGIPTVNGAVHFDDRYIGNPLVYCGCVGVMPNDMIEGEAAPGDLIVAIGGRTGRDGIHGATFSSAELTDTHADEFSHAVQIGNAIEEKRLLDAILRARDHADGCLFRAITDCGAGGFSSAVGEMGEKVGATVDLDRAPLKYDGLTYDEIWISEAQERMVLAVPEANLGKLRAICEEEGSELSVLGTFGTAERELVLRYHGEEVGRMSMAFLHDGIPTPTREAEWRASSSMRVTSREPEPDVRDALLKLLADPIIASKHWIIRQYDHEVQGNTVVKPLVGRVGRGPSDAAVIEPVPGTGRGLAIACGLQTGVGDVSAGGDPYQMALAAIDECVRNLVCVGADPDRIAILDNFCWPSCKKPENLASLVRACVGCYDGAKAYRTPFVSGKDSLNNQFTTEDGKTIEIPATLLITGIGIVEDLSRVVTSDAKRVGNSLVMLSASPDLPMRGSSYERLFGLGDQKTDEGDSVQTYPSVDLGLGPRSAKAMHTLIKSGRIRSVHDVSDGGLLVAVSEMLIGGSSSGRSLGASIGFQGSGPDVAEYFGEAPSRYVLEIEDAALGQDEQDALREELDALAEGHGAWLHWFGELTDSGRLESQGSWDGTVSWTIEELTKAWRGTLDW